VKTYLPGGTKVTAAYDAAFKCITSAYKQKKNFLKYYYTYYYARKLVVFLQHIVTFLHLS